MDIGSNFNANYNSYKYSFSIWMRNQKRYPSFTNSPSGRSTDYFFKLDDSFALYFDSPTTFKVHIFALKNYLEITTEESFYFPMHEWANI